MRSIRMIFNAGFSIVQVLVTSGANFLFYRLIVKELSVSSLGIWSIVGAVTAIAGISNGAAAVSVVKFIAEDGARHNFQKAGSIIHTITLLVAALTFGVCLILYFISPLVFELVLPAAKVPQALSIFPQVLIAFGINMIGMVWMFALDGFHLIYLRNIVQMLAAFTLLISSYLLVDKGLEGIATAQIIQFCVLLGSSIALLKIFVKDFKVFEFKWDRPMFREIWQYSYKNQLASISTLFYDPVTKFLLSRYGGLEFVGFFEMANRLIFQIRSLIVTANQVVVPHISTLSVLQPLQIRESYLKMVKLLTPLCLLVGIAMVMFTPFVSLIWIGEYNFLFSAMSYILIIGWLSTILSAAAYFTNLGTGHLRFNTIQHFIIGLANLFLGVLSSFLGERWGIIIAWSLALCLGSFYLITRFQYQYKIRILEWLQPNYVRLAIVSLIFLFLVKISHEYLLTYGFHWSILLGIYSIIYTIWAVWVIKTTPSMNAIVQHLANFLSLKTT